jgi:hypothetical protein
MHTLDTYDLVVSIVTVVVMPVLIWANLRDSGIKSPMHTYLWRESPNFMRCALAVLAILTLFSVVSLLSNFGLITPEMAEALSVGVGIPFVVVGLIMFWFLGKALIKGYRDWRAGRLSA